ncbi:MAG TPA: hypothetical protein EYP73_06670 [Acidimicrobiia bacterium]|nr:hypothetical protein [Acidimicrobiia bacterium]
MRVARGRYETLGGLITAELGRLPQVGDQVEVGGWTFEVLAVEGFRVDWVRVHPPERKHQ